MKARFLLPIFLMFALVTTTVTAQSTEYTLSEESTMIIEGTSTIHDWEATVEKMDLSVIVNTEGNDNPHVPQRPFSSVLLEVPVEAIESGKGKMNGKIYDALKVKDHPFINFELVNATVSEGKMGEGEFTLDVKGNLTIKGINRRIEFPVKANKLDNGTFTIVGSYDLNMKDYQVDPPSAMFGTIKSGEEVTISFDLQMNAPTPQTAHNTASK